jgi:hypothetical protein
MEFLLDIPLEVTVELGRTKQTGAGLGHRAGQTCGRKP